MSCLRCLCMHGYSGAFCFVLLRLMYHIFPVSRDCPFVHYHLGLFIYHVTVCTTTDN